MKTRIISGALYGAAMIVFMILGSWPLLLWNAFIGVVGYYEMARATGVLNKDQKCNIFIIVSWIATLGYYALWFFNVSVTYILLYILVYMTCIMTIFVFSFPKYNGQQVMNCFFAFVYAPIMTSFIWLAREFHSSFDTDRYGIGFFAVWLICIAAWFSDMGAYFVGVFLGKHKIAPHLSPKKTIEGCVGGVFFAGLGGFILSLVLYMRHIVNMDMRLVFTLICMAGSICGQVGDLAASGIKRHFGIKDYGKIIPGHGGVCDRFDSIIFTGPMIYLLTITFLK